MHRTLVTGANGFVGRAVVAELIRRGVPVRAATREAPAVLVPGAEHVAVGDIDGATPWSAALAGVSAVVHLASRAHVLREHAVHPLTEFRRVNVDGTLNLARQAAAAGVRRVVFVSSIGVNGAETTDLPFCADDVPAPHSPYAISKHEAETGLRHIASESRMDVVIVRPPLVIGPGAPGNFNRLLRAVYRGIPLPFGAIHNRRSVVSLDNLVALLAVCIDHPAAADRTFLAGDGVDISTPHLVRQMAAALGRSSDLIPVPATMLRWVARVVGKTDLARQLCGSLQVDIQPTCDRLGWGPRVTTDETLKQSALYFLQTRRS